MLSRKITLIIHFIIDELLPPLIRDSKIFSFTFGAILFGKRTEDFIRFKNDAAKLNSKSFEKAYTDLNPYFIKRETDLNRKCIEQLKKDVIGKKILDAGCGNGYLTKVLQNENNKVIGFDINPPLTSLDAKFSFVKGNLEKLPFKDKEFDTVVCTHTLEHVINLQNVVNELRRVTSERLLIVTPLQRPYNFTFDLHLHFFPYPYSFINAVGAPKGYYYVKNCGGDLYYFEQK
jgi:ubiquinone/menaquinone biosynthesis C-methylase UbiE